MGGGQVVPLAAPAEDQVAGQIRLVRDRPVRVALRVRRFAASVRLDPLANLALGVGRTAGLAAVLDGEVTVRSLAVGDALGSDYARVADVDHVRRLHVQADPEARAETRRPAQQPDGQSRRGGGAETPTPR